MQSGSLRHRLRFETPVRIKDESGEVIVDQWVEAFTVWGSIEPVTGREYMSASEFRSGVTSKLRVRWRADLDASMRVICKGTTYDISAILPVQGLREEVLIMCSSGIVADGGQP